MFTKADFEKLQTQALEWVQANILTMDFAVQMAVILAAFTIGILVYRLARPKLQERINSLKINYRFAEILRALIKLLIPAVALIVMMVSVGLIRSFTMDATFADAITKLTMAWIGIRLIVQFIEKRFVRQLAGWVIWGIAALSIFGVLEQTSAALDAVGLNLGDFRLSALSIIKGLLALAALIYIANILANLSDRQIKRIESLSPSSRVLITKIARVFLIVAALMIGITTAGIDLSLLAVFSGAVGLGIGFGLQKVISNLFSGMLLLIDESIKPGDIIELPSSDGLSTYGWVNHMGARYTEIVTRDNKSFLVPNEDFITQQVVNWSHGDTLVRVRISFGVHYDSDPHEVKRICEEAAKNLDRVVDSPEPVVWLSEFGDSSINFVMNFWIQDAEKGITNIKGMVMMALWDAFKENDIQIPYPHREVFIHDAAPKKKKEEKKKTA